MAVTIVNELHAGSICSDPDGPDPAYVVVYAAGGFIRRRHQSTRVSLPVPTSGTDDPSATWPPHGTGHHDAYELEIEVAANDQPTQSVSVRLGTGTYTLSYFFPSDEAAIVHYGLFDAAGTRLADLGFAAEHY